MLRANPVTLGTPDAATYKAFSAPGTIAIDTTCLNATGCGRNTFVPTAIALWQQQLAAVLPQGQGTVCLDSTPNDGTPSNWKCDNATLAPYVIKVCWDESRLGSTSSATGNGGTSSSGGVLCTYTIL